METMYYPLDLKIVSLLSPSLFGVKMSWLFIRIEKFDVRYHKQLQ